MQVVERGPVLRIERERRADLADGKRVGAPPGRGERGAVVGEDDGGVRAERRRAGEVRQGLRKTARSEQQITDVDVGVRVVRVDR